MAERYTRVFSQQDSFYCPGAPVIIKAGALLKDNQTGRIIAQVKFKSVSSKAIRALTIKICAKDISGAEVEGVEKFQFLDLNVRRDEEFGAKTPVVLPNVIARAFTCQCISAVFTDGSSWNCGEDMSWNVLPAPVFLNKAIGANLVEQYRRDTKTNAEYKITTHEDLWYCGCGEINHANEAVCHKCRTKKESLLAALNVDTLSANKKKYDEAVAAEAAERAEAEQVQAAKKKKIGIIVGSIAVFLLAVFLIITQVIIPANDYKNATALLDSGEYEAAEEAFLALGNYQDAQIMILECRYQNALHLIEVGEYDEAYTILKALETYSNAAQKIVDSKYERLLLALQAKDYKTAQPLAQDLIENQPTQDYLLQAVQNAISAMNYEDACQIVDLLYASSNQLEQAKEALYQEAVAYHEKKEFDNANLLFTYLGDYKDSQDRLHTHEYATKVLAEATCEMDGKQESRCTCGSVLETALPAIGHNYINATCTKPKTCDNCGKTEGAALGHTVTSGKCQRCNSIILTQSDLQGTWKQTWDGGSRTYVFSGNSFSYEERLPNGVVCIASGTFTVFGNKIYLTGPSRITYTDGRDDYVYSYNNSEREVVSFTSGRMQMNGFTFYKV